MGRTRVTSWSLAVSGTCAATAGLFFHAPGLLAVPCLVWGFAVAAAGPVAGIAAMQALRRLPEAGKMASGRR